LTFQRKLSGEPLGSASEAAAMKFTVANLAGLVGFDVKWVPVGAMRSLAHHRLREIRAEPALWAGSQPPPATAFDQGRKPRPTTGPAPIWRAASITWPNVENSLVFCSRASTLPEKASWMPTAPEP